MLLKVHIGVLVGVDQLEVELVDFEHCANVHVTQREILGELDRVSWLVRLLHPASLQELAAFEAYSSTVSLILLRFRYTLFIAYLSLSTSNKLSSDIHRILGHIQE